MAAPRTAVSDQDRVASAVRDVVKTLLPPPEDSAVALAWALARRLLADGDGGAALRALDLLPIDVAEPSNSDRALLQGLAYGLSGRFDLALRDIMSAAEARKNGVREIMRLIERLAIPSFSRTLVSTATEDLQRLAQSRTADVRATALVLCSILSARIGQIEEAEALVREAYSVDASMAQAELLTLDADRIGLNDGAASEHAIARLMRSGGMLKDAVIHAQLAVALYQSQQTEHFEAEARNGGRANEAAARRLVGELLAQLPGVTGEAAEEFHRAGIEFHRATRYAEAVECLRQAEELGSTDAETAYFLADALRMLVLPEDAEAGERLDEAHTSWLRGANRASPTRETAWFWVTLSLIEEGLAARDTSSADSIARHRLMSALAAEAAALMSRRKFDLIWVARAYYGLELERTALAAAEQALEHDPESPEALETSIIGRIRFGDFDRAERLNERRAEIVDDSWSMMVRAQLRGYQGRDEEMYAELGRMARREDDLPERPKMEVECLTLLGRHDEARRSAEIYLDGLDLDGQIGRLHRGERVGISAAVAAAAIGRFDAAIRMAAYGLDRAIGAADRALTEILLRALHAVERHGVAAPVEIPMGLSPENRVIAKRLLNIIEIVAAVHGLLLRPGALDPLRESAASANGGPTDILSELSAFASSSGAPELQGLRQAVVKAARARISLEAGDTLEAARNYAILSPDAELRYAILSPDAELRFPAEFGLEVALTDLEVGLSADLHPDAQVDTTRDICDRIAAATDLLLMGPVLQGESNPLRHETSGLPLLGHFKALAALGARYSGGPEDAMRLLAEADAALGGYGGVWPLLFGKGGLSPPQTVPAVYRERLMMELGLRLGDAAEANLSALVEEKIPALRNRLQSQTGVVLPGLRLRATYGLAQWEYRAYAAGGLVAKGSSAPRPSVRAKPSSPIDPMAEPLEHLERELRGRLDLFFDDEDVAALRRRWRDADDALPELPDDGIDPLFAEIVRALAHECVPLLDGAAIEGSFASRTSNNCGEILRKVRLALVPRLPGLSDGGPRRVVPGELLATFATTPVVDHWDTRRPDPTVRRRIVSQLQQLADGAALVIEDPRLRRPLRILIEKELPATAVLSAEEVERAVEAASWEEVPAPLEVRSNAGH